MENESAAIASRGIAGTSAAKPSTSSVHPLPDHRAAPKAANGVVDHRQADLHFLQSKSKEVCFSHLEGTKYVAMATIGSGAYGVVCAALDKKTKEKVAIKKIPNAMEMSVIAKRTFREIKILKHFKHEIIVGIKDILLSNEERTTTTGGKDGSGPAGTTTTTTHSLKDIYVVLDFMESDLHHIIHSKQVKHKRKKRDFGNFLSRRRIMKLWSLSSGINSNFY